MAVVTFNDLPRRMTGQAGGNDTETALAARHERDFVPHPFQHASLGGSSPLRQGGIALHWQGSLPRCRSQASGALVTVAFPPVTRSLTLQTSSGTAGTHEILQPFAGVEVQEA